MANQGEPSLRFVVEADDADAAEVAAAEAFAAGAAGLEERGTEGSAGISLVIYAAPERAGAVGAAIASGTGIRCVSGPEPVEAVDWGSRWREGLGPLVISPELVVRPSFAASRLGPGQSEVVIDPGQAFGTGEHESTRLALDLLARLPASLRHGASVLDVGTGSGVLALAALRLGAVRAVAFDLDAKAVAVAKENAERNGLAGAFVVFAGPVDALATRVFDVVVANLLKRELLPLARDLATRVSRGGALLVSGLLAGEAEQVRDAFASHGLGEVARAERDDSSGERWLGLRFGFAEGGMRRGCQTASARATASTTGAATGGRRP